MKLFYPMLMQVEKVESPDSPWLLPGAVIFVFVMARFFFMRRSIRREPSDESSDPGPLSALAETKPADPAPSLAAVPGTSTQYLAFTQPPMAPYALAGGCYDKDLDPVLAIELERLGPEVFMLVAANENQVTVQSRDGVCRLARNTLQEIQLHPVFPAKGGGMVMLIFLRHANDEEIHRTFLDCPSYSKELQDWCYERARVLAKFLQLPLKVTRESYDC